VTAAAPALRGNYTVTNLVVNKAAILKAPMPPPDHDPDPVGPDYPPAAGPYDGPDLKPGEGPLPLPVDEQGKLITLSDFDTVTNYDGEAHTYNTNALYAALEMHASTNAFFGNPYTVEYSTNGFLWVDEPYFYTNADETPTSFWYRVTVPNFSNYIHAVGITITQRVSTITFEAKDKVYDMTTNATCTATNFVNVVPGEGFVLETRDMTFAFSDADIGSNKLVTAYGYGDGLVKPLDGTLKSNYAFVFVPTNYANITEKIVDLKVVVRPEEFAWDGTAKFPTEIVVTDDGTTLTKDVDYTYEEFTAIDLTNAVVKVTGKGNYAGSSGQTNFWITAYEITTWIEDECQGTNRVGSLSGTEVSTNAVLEGYCVDVQNSVTNGVVRKVDHEDGILRLTVRLEKDSNDDDVPDKYQRKLTFRVVNGWWDADTSQEASGSGPQCVWVTKFKMEGDVMTDIWDVNGTGLLAGVPAVGDKPFGGAFAKGGLWWPETPYDGMAVTNGTSPLFIFGYNHAAGGGSHRPGSSTAQPPKFSVVPDISTFSYEGGRATFAVNQKAYESGTLVVSMPLEATQVTIQGSESLSPADWKDLQSKSTDADGYVTLDDLGAYRFFRISVETH